MYSVIGHQAMFAAGYERVQSNYYMTQSSIHSLPSRLCPVYGRQNSWKKGIFPDDFIFVGEFSELEGPKPLEIIPADGHGEFDLNQFVVRIMSVDYQTSSSHVFDLVDDTQVVFTDKKSGIYAYIHHFTLYDIHARGYVRPFCMAFVTKDKHKLMSMYKQMLIEFNKVSEYFKYSNAILFKKDLETYQSDLQFTKESLEWKHKEELYQQKDNGVTEDAIQFVQTEISEILEKLDSLEKNDKLEKRLKKYEKKNHACKKNLFPDSASLNEMDLSFKEDSTMKSEKRSATFSETDYSRLNSSIEYQPKLVQSLNLRKFDQPLRMLCELCELGAKEGLNRLRVIHQMFGRHLAALVVEDLESVLMAPSPSLLTIGGCPHVNVINGIILPKETIHEGLGLDAEFTVNPLRRLLKWHSEETLDSYKSVDSHWSEIVGDERFSSPRPSNASSLVETLTTAQGNVASDGIERSSVQFERESTGSFENITFEESSLTESEIDNEVNEYLDKDRDVVTSVRRDSNHIIEDMWKKKRKSETRSFADWSTAILPLSSGYNIHSFMCQNEFSPHVMYSLMSGRPVIILATSGYETVVRQMVATLALFVPGYSFPSQSVIPWSYQPIKMPDLTRIKLIGLCKPERRSTSRVLPHSIRAYVSIYYYEKNTLVSPCYQGGVLTTIYNKRRSFKRDEPYLSYIHCELLQLASKAEAFYHTFCISGASHETLPFNIFQMCNVYNSKAMTFCKNIGVKEGDFPIIQYLTEVIKVQQMKQCQLFQNEVDSICPVKVDFTECHIFKK